ncbi:MAG: Verru_Chthon cassette protein D, partial [Verrucomicrobia bacterium]|nr:Verru_Chthon cassette protein D [Verrucomicrobiota bacterium]
NRAEQMVQQQLASARQTAIARNRRVEVRFYKFDNPDDIGTTQTFCALQSFLIDDLNAATPIGRLTKLPATVLINESAANSSLFTVSDKTWTAGTDPQITLPGVSTYTAKAFQFRPDGSTSLSSASNWFLTLHAATAGATASSLPPNFATIQIDPVSGAVRTYRP